MTLGPSPTAARLPRSYSVTHEKAANMTIPPMMGPAGPDLWMAVGDVFYIRGRGTVVTGQLAGNGLLSVGDTVHCEGQRWQVGAIEQFRQVLTMAQPGMNIGVLLRNGPPGDVLRGRVIQFEQQNPAAQPQWTELAPKKKRWRR
jgi:translation elongation factor EF-Tu-like GTPase